MVHEFIGEVHLIKETDVVNERFQKREFILNDKDDEYPQVIAFELTQGKCDDILAFNVGDMVKVKYNIRGREWHPPQGGEIRYFVSLNAWRIEKVGPAGQNDGPVSRQEHEPAGMDDSSIDDIPF